MDVAAVVPMVVDVDVDVMFHCLQFVQLPTLFSLRFFSFPTCLLLAKLKFMLYIIPWYVE